MMQSFDTSRLEFLGEPVTVAEQLGSYREASFFSASTNGVLVYRTGSGGDSQLTRFDRQGKVLGTAGERGLYDSLALSPDGTLVAVERLDPQNGKEALSGWLICRGAQARGSRLAPPVSRTLSGLQTAVASSSLPALRRPAYSISIRSRRAAPKMRSFC